MEFPTSKNPELIPFVLAQILDNCITGITLSDPDQDDNPIVYANAMFELITGYDQDEIIGRNCRFLQGEERGQEELETLRDAIGKRKSVTVTLRNFRKNGDLFYNRLTVRPLFDPEGNLIDASAFEAAVGTKAIQQAQTGLIADMDLIADAIYKRG